MSGGAATAAAPDAGRPPAERPGGERTSAFEWLVALAGLALVLGAVAFLLARAAGGGDGPPDLRARADSVTRMGDAYRVHVTVENRSRATAADVSVVGEPPGGGDAGGAVGRVRFDYVPGGSERRGTLVVPRDPGRSPPRVRVEGYREP